MKIDLARLPVPPQPLCEFSTAEAVDNRVSVRTAHEHEAAVVLDIYIRHLFPIANFTPDLESCARVVYSMVSNGTVFVAVRNRTIIGVASYMVCRQWYMSVDQVWEQGAVVVPEFRKCPALYRLIQALIGAAKARGLDLVMSTNTRGGGGGAMMNKRYRKTGELFVVECA